MLFNWKTEQFYQLGVVHGMISHCGNPDFPGVYARIEDPTVYQFIKDQLCEYNTIRPIHIFLKMTMSRFLSDQNDRKAQESATGPLNVKKQADLRGVKEY